MTDLPYNQQMRKGQEKGGSKQQQKQSKQQRKQQKPQPESSSESSENADIDLNQVEGGQTEQMEVSFIIG